MSDRRIPGPASWAFITPSYSGDLERCRLLCRSMDALVTGPWHHYVIVDQPDYPLFREFAGPRRTILLTHDIVPKGMRHVMNIPFTQGRSLWWSRSTGAVLGWHQQQFVKIGMAGHVSDDGLVYCDSDVFFIKPFDVSALSRDGRLRIYHAPNGGTPNALPNPKFTLNALKILGLPLDGTFHDFVDNVITWHRDTVLGMCRHIEKVSGRSWHGALARRLQISEYALYGNYVEGVLQGAAPVFFDTRSLCRTKWDREKMSDAQVREFCATLLDHQVAIGIQSFAGIDEGLLASIYEQALKAGGPAARPQQALGA